MCILLKDLCMTIGSFSFFRGICLNSGSGKLLIVSQLWFTHRLSGFTSTFLPLALIYNRCFEDWTSACLFIECGKCQMRTLCLKIALSYHPWFQIEVFIDSFLISVFVYYLLCDRQKVLVAIVHYTNIIYCLKPIII